MAATGVDSIDFDVRVHGEKTRGKAAISIAKHERMPRVGTLRQEMEPAAFKHRPEREVFHPAVEARNGIEVRRVSAVRGSGSNAHLFPTYIRRLEPGFGAPAYFICRKNSRGVSRAASAAMRRVRELKRSL